MEIKTKGVTFNLEDAWQKKLYDFVCGETTNFSAYMKSLIQREMESGSRPSQTQIQKESQYIDTTENYDISSFIKS